MTLRNSFFPRAQTRMANRPVFFLSSLHCELSRGLGRRREAPRVHSLSSLTRVPESRCSVIFLPIELSPSLDGLCRTRVLVEFLVILVLFVEVAASPVEMFRVVQLRYAGTHQRVTIRLFSSNKV